MSEERTPIEELREILYNNDMLPLPYPNNIDDLLEADKAYREKYKHTKEDVIKAHANGSETCLQWEQGQSMKDKAEQYYNETHNK